MKQNILCCVVGLVMLTQAQAETFDIPAYIKSPSSTVTVASVDDVAPFVAELAKQELLAINSGQALPLAESTADDFRIARLAQFFVSDEQLVENATAGLSEVGVLDGLDYRGGFGVESTSEGRYVTVARVFGAESGSVLVIYETDLDAFQGEFKLIREMLNVKIGDVPGTVTFRRAKSGFSTSTLTWFTDSKKYTLVYAGDNLNASINKTIVDLAETFINVN